MSYYTKKFSNNQQFGVHNSEFLKTSHTCTTFSRCHDFRTCKTCNFIHTQKLKKQFFDHLDEDIIKSYEFKYFIRFRSNETCKDYHYRYKNVDLNFFINELITKTRNANFALNKDSEYIINKEVSSNEEYGINPHAHMILLSNIELDLNNKQLKDMLNKYSIDIHVDTIYKKNDSYLESVINCFTYMNKYTDEQKEILENSYQFKNDNTPKHLFKGEHSNRHSKLFKINHIPFILDSIKTNYLSKFSFLISLFFLFKIAELQEKLYIKIKVEHKQKIKLAKTIFKRNSNKSNPKQYIRLLKSLHKKIKLANLQQGRKISRLWRVQF